MKVEYLLNMLVLQDPNTIRIIAKNLNVLPPIAECKTGYLIKVIVNQFNNPSSLAKIRLPLHTINALEQYIIKNQGIPIEHQNTLENYGFFICGNVPDEIEAFLRPKWLRKYINELPQQFEPITLSAFTKLQLFLVYLEREKNIKLHNKRNGKQNRSHIEKINNNLMYWHNRDVLLEIIQYLKSRKLVHWENNIITPSTLNIANWKRSGDYETLVNFYECMFSQMRVTELKYLIKEISATNAIELTWVSSRFFKKERLKYVNDAVKLGLVRTLTKDDEILLQLTPEGTYYATGRKPDLWLQNNLIISADYDLHIPYNHDPFLIGKLYSETTMVNNEFFIILRIDPMTLANKKGFIKLIQSYCRRIPEVVKFEFDTFSM